MVKASPAYKKNVMTPDERRDFRGHGRLNVLSLGDGSIVGYGTFEPGWRWSTDVKPISETESCEATHTGYCIKGSMTIRMNNGDEFKIQAGDAFHIPPGHDAWVDGSESCEMIDFTGFGEYAKEKPGAKAA